MNRVPILTLLVAVGLSAIAGEADVLEVAVSCNDDSICRFDVTVAHADEGWEHYSNRWEVLSPNGELLATRELAHPHENEQPFTRSESGIEIPAGVTTVYIEGQDNVHGLSSDNRFELAVPE